MTDRKGLPRWVDAVPIAAAVFAMMAWTWRTWPDPLIDFGRELYLAWQLSLGRTLYADNAYYDGPLPPYLNATWMKLFGPTLSTILVANFLVMLAAIVLLYLLFQRIAGRIAAVTGTLLFVAISCFGRLVPSGNYNFMAPYSHHFTYGFVLTLAAIASLHLPSALRTTHLLTAGLLLGLVLLTKVEFAFAAVVAVLLGAALRIRSEQMPHRLRSGLLLLLGAALPPLVAILLLSVRLPVATALRGTLGSIYWTFASRISSLPFFQAGLGLDDIRGNLVAMLTGALLIALAAAFAVAAGFIVPGITRTRHSKLAPALLFLLTGILLAFTLGSPHWFSSIPKALPFVAAVLVVVWLVFYWRAPLRSDDSRLFAARLTVSMYALALLGKMILNTRLYHYGFVLAVPALLLLAAGFVSWLPSAAADRGADPGVVRAVGLALALALAVIYVGSMIPLIREQRYIVGTGPNRFYADERGAAEQTIVNWINHNVPAQATVAVIPEGAMINFLARRSNPTPHSIFMPPEMFIFGENHVLDSFKAHPPDFVVLAHKDTSEFGVPLFGRDYGQQIGNWIRENYTPIAQVGERPLQDPDHFGILIMRRIAAYPSTP